MNLYTESLCKKKIVTVYPNVCGLVLFVHLIFLFSFKKNYNTVQSFMYIAFSSFLFVFVLQQQSQMSKLTKHFKVDVISQQQSGNQFINIHVKP